MSAPLLIFIAGPNGAGKSTFWRAHLQSLGLLFVNADDMMKSLAVPNEKAARMADELRDELVRLRVSFATETVFSDACGAKLQFLRNAVAAGYDVRLVYVGIASVSLSEARVASRVRRGGHNVPTERLSRRYQQSLKNLASALPFVTEAHIYDNSSSRTPYVRVFQKLSGQSLVQMTPVPLWLLPAVA
jgi:predicted ABC-type ATPase